MKKILIAVTIAATLSGCAHSVAHHTLPAMTASQAQSLSDYQIKDVCTGYADTYRQNGFDVSCNAETFSVLKADVTRRQSLAAAKKASNDTLVAKQIPLVEAEARKLCDLTNKVGQSVHSLSEKVARAYYKGETVTSKQNEVKLLIRAYSDHAPITAAANMDPRAILFGTIRACASQDTLHQLWIKDPKTLISR